MTGRLRTPPLILFLVAALLVLLPLLAYFQYEWLGKVSEGERQELLRSLQNGAGDFRRDFDKEISSVYTSFELTSPATTPAISNDDIRQSYAAIYKHWNETASHPALVQRLILILYGNQGQPQPEQLNPVSGKFETIEWPPELTRFRETLNGPSNKSVTSDDGLRHLLAVPQDPVDPKIPALFITIISASSDSPDHLEIGSPVGHAVVQLNLDYLQKNLIPSLVQAHFTANNPDFNVAVVDRSAPSRVIYSNGGASSSDVTGDITESLFSLSPLDLPEGLKGKLAILKDSEETTESTQEGPPGKTFSVRIVRSGRGQVANQTFFRSDTPGWQLVVTHRAGSLDAAVAQLRQKNLAISFSILLLLAFSVGMILISVRRERQLAQQQMEFVSTVSHELRTPLAVICSAGENLADGIIDDPERTRKYGALVRNEGRRLADMVEQVLDFAGIQSGRQIYSLKPVEISDVIERALAPFEMQLQERGVKLETKASDSIPLVQADRDVLIRAVQNLIGNALKYGADGAWLSVRAEAAPESVQIVVEDRGSGIPAADLPHIFEPFYRGGAAIAAQIKGSGLGLALVKQIAEAHHGRVTVESSAGKGSRFAIVLPTVALS